MVEQASAAGERRVNDPAQSSMGVDDEARFDRDAKVVLRRARSCVENIAGLCRPLDCSQSGQRDMAEEESKIRVSQAITRRSQDFLVARPRENQRH